MSNAVSAFMDNVIAKNPAETVFHQAVQEVVESLLPILDRHPDIRDAKVLERMVEPERVIMFRVPWVDDAGKVNINLWLQDGSGFRHTRYLYQSGCQQTRWRVSCIDQT